MMDTDEFFSSPSTSRLVNRHVPSPGGHVSKRRVRSKLSSNELSEDIADSPFIRHVSFLICVGSIEVPHV